MGPWKGNRSCGRRMKEGGEEIEIQEGFQSQGEQNKPLPL
jgi:hypothetical protein